MVAILPLAFAPMPGQARSEHARDSIETLPLMSRRNSKQDRVIKRVLHGSARARTVTNRSIERPRWT